VTEPIPVIFNPVAGRGRLLNRRAAVIAAADSAGGRLEWWPTGFPGHATELARRAVAESRPLVFAFGGDGTYNEVARGLIGSRTAMGLLPGGTTSVLAYELAVPRPAEAALRSLLAGQDREVHVGRTDHGELFLLMLSVGPDAVILHRLPGWLKQHGSKVGITAQAVVEFLRGDLPKVHVDGGEWQETGGWVIVGNGACYGGPYRATPGADLFRADLEIVVQRPVGRRRAVPFFFGIPSGRHLRLRGVVRHPATRVRIEAANDDQQVPYQIDGDPIGKLPVEVWMAPETLRMRVPAPSSDGSQRSANSGVEM